MVSFSGGLNYAIDQNGNIHYSYADSTWCPDSITTTDTTTTTNSVLGDSDYYKNIELLKVNGFYCGRNEKNEKLWLSPSISSLVISDLDLKVSYNYFSDWLCYRLMIYNIQMSVLVADKEPQEIAKKYIDKAEAPELKVVDRSVSFYNDIPKTFDDYLAEFDKALG